MKNFDKIFYSLAGSALVFTLGLADSSPSLLFVIQNLHDWARYNPNLAVSKCDRYSRHINPFRKTKWWRRLEAVQDRASSIIISDFFMLGNLWGSLISWKDESHIFHTSWENPQKWFNLLPPCWSLKVAREASTYVEKYPDNMKFSYRSLVLVRLPQRMLGDPDEDPPSGTEERCHSSPRSTRRAVEP